MSKAQDFDIVLVGDEELMKALTSLDYKTQQKYNKRIVRDAARATIVDRLRKAAPRGPTGNLKKSMGIVTGKSKRSAVMFAGPRMSHGRNKDGSKREGHAGWVANIIEFNKGQNRYPGKDRSGRPRKRPRVAGASSSLATRKVDTGIRKHSGKMPLTHKGFGRRAILGGLKDAENHMAKSVRKIIEKTFANLRKHDMI